MAAENVSCQFSGQTALHGLLLLLINIYLSSASPYIKEVVAAGIRLGQATMCDNVTTHFVGQRNYLHALFTDHQRLLN